MATQKGNKELIRYVGILVDNLYNNGKYAEGAADFFLPQLPQPEIDLIRHLAFASNLVSPIQRIDMDTGEPYDGGEVRLSYIGVIEMRKHGSFINYRKSWRQRFHRFAFTLIEIPWSSIVKFGRSFSKVLTPINTLSTIILTLATVWLLIDTHRKDTTINQMSTEKKNIERERDSLIQLTKTQKVLPLKLINQDSLIK